jgi:hypothetical protein
MRPPPTGLGLDQLRDSQARAYAVVLHTFNVIAFIVVGFVLLHGHICRDPADDALVSGP